MKFVGKARVFRNMNPFGKGIVEEEEKPTLRGAKPMVLL